MFASKVVCVCVCEPTYACIVCLHVHFCMQVNTCHAMHMKGTLGASSVLLARVTASFPQTSPYQFVT